MSQELHSPVMARIGGGTSARSLHGCWTCRVRKKKCDENRPLCSTCASLELECHAYGEKPAWMDSGPLQREQALKVKRVVSQNNSHRRRRRMLRTSSPLQEINLEMEFIHEELSSTSEAPSNYSADRAQLHGTGWDVETLGSGSFDGTAAQIWNMDLDVDLEFLGEDVSGAPSQENTFAAELLFSSPRWANTGRFDDKLTGRGGEGPSAVHKQSEDTGSKSTPTPKTYNLQKGSGEHRSVTSEKAILEGVKNVSGIDSAEWSWSSKITSGPAVKSGTATKDDSILGDYPENLVLREEKEDVLFMHYLDEVFYTQYPFYNSSLKQSRGWLFSTLKRVKSVYLATLALSECHMQSASENPMPPTQSNKNHYYEMALAQIELKVKRFSSLGGRSSLVHGIESLTCVLQILFYEQFTGGAGNWRTQLLAAGSLITPLIEARKKSIESGSSDLPYGNRQSPGGRMNFGDDIGTKVLVGSIILFDIIASASTRSQPSLALDHRNIVEMFEIELASLFGCTNRVVSLILEIVLLDNWKKEAEKSRKMSMVEVVRRAAKIEPLLQQQIADLQSSSTESSRNTLSASQREITNIFSLSALTYLHVVVSGAHPELPEIEESVSRTLSAFQSLTDPKSLRNLVWHFCVSGCLALEGQQMAFRELVSKAKITPSTIGTCLQAFEIMEESWEMRRNFSYNCDWVFIMNKRGSNVLLT